jgi:hypothetical protein
MNEAPIRTPTLAELRAAGYVVEIEHDRLNRVAYAKNGKLIVKEVLSSGIPGLEEEVKGSELGFGMVAVLPKGGMTEVWVTDPETSAEFYGYGRCHPNDNYSKRDGINEALKKIAGLMMVMDGKEGFKCRLQL